MNMISRVTLNFQLTRLTANAIMEAKKSTRMTEGMVIRAEFQAYWAKPPWVQAWTKLSKLKDPPKLK
ncbi:hypothetical protein ACRQ5B_07050 [Pseudarthrobacter sp. L19]|uniref:hypothetical protein n=1 Tax=Pseudarthrobacter sp. L19 TaxID=3423951 RepID=UPI003D799E5F